MKACAAALTVAVGLMFANPVLAQTAFDDAMALVEREPARALAAFEALAAQGDNEAVNAVAIILYDPPDGIPADPVRAVRLWEQAIANGSDAARLNLATRLLLNDEPGDDARAVALLQAVEEAELRRLTDYPLGRAYLFGDGVEQDLERGSRLMMRAVEARPENIGARFLMGRAYQNGWGIPVDLAAAYRHLKAAADGGDPRAQWNVGMALLNGEGVSANPILAHQYVRASAEGGDVSGMISMAVMLAVGQGVSPDPPEARRWYRRAAETGSAHALRGLGAMLLTGEGGQADAVTGAAYLGLAAKAGDTIAQRMLQVHGEGIATLDQGAIEAAKAAWLREYGVPR